MKPAQSSTSGEHDPAHFARSAPLNKKENGVAASQSCHGSSEQAGDRQPGCVGGPQTRRKGPA